MGALLESLKRYFENTSKDILENVWKENEYLDNIGPDITEYVNSVQEYFRVNVNYEDNLHYNNITTDIKQVQAVFAAIYDLSSKVKNQESVIANAMEEQNTGNQQILEAMHSITEATTTVRNGSSEMMIGGEQIVKEMKQLSDDTKQINESMNEIKSYVTQISDAIAITSGSTTQTQTNLKRLMDDLSRFSV